MSGTPPELFELGQNPTTGGTNAFVLARRYPPGSMSRLLHLDEGAKVEGSFTITQLLGVTHSRIRAPVHSSVRTVLGGAAGVRLRRERYRGIRVCH